MYQLKTNFFPDPNIRNKRLSLYMPPPFIDALKLDFDGIRPLKWHFKWNLDWLWAAHKNKAHRGEQPGQWANPKPGLIAQGRAEQAHVSSHRPSVHTSYQPHVLRRHTSNSKSTMCGVFAPQKFANSTNQSFFPVREPTVKISRHTTAYKFSWPNVPAALVDSCCLNNLPF